MHPLKTIYEKIIKPHLKAEYSKYAGDLNAFYPNIYDAKGTEFGIVVVLKCELDYPRAIVFLENCPVFKGKNLIFTADPEAGTILIR